MTSTDDNAMSHSPDRAEEYKSTELMDFDQAIAHLLDFADRPLLSSDQPHEQTLPLADCYGKVLAHSIFAPSAIPPAPVSALDGYAVNTDDLDMEGETCLPVSLRVAAGYVAPPLPRGTAARIFTGATLPPASERGYCTGSQLPCRWARLFHPSPGCRRRRQGARQRP